MKYILARLIAAALSIAVATSSLAAPAFPIRTAPIRSQTADSAFFTETAIIAPLVIEPLKSFCAIVTSPLRKLASRRLRPESAMGALTGVNSTWSRLVIDVIRAAAGGGEELTENGGWRAAVAAALEPLKVLGWTDARLLAARSNLQAGGMPTAAAVDALLDRAGQLRESGAVPERKPFILPSERPGKTRGLIAVIGGGPAGKGAGEAFVKEVKALAIQGYEVVIFNRDVKYGGLAEYGVFVEKEFGIKEEYRGQFRKLLEGHQNIHYMGNVTVGVHGDISLDDLRRMGFSGLAVAVGAQGVKKLGVPHEDDYDGIYDAKNIVYYYNGQPHFDQEYAIEGEEAALVGIGNVTVDVTNWLIHRKDYVVIKKFLDELSAVDESLSSDESLLNDRLAARITDGENNLEKMPRGTREEQKAHRQADEGLESLRELAQHVKLHMPRVGKVIRLEDMDRALRESGLAPWAERLHQIWDETPMEETKIVHWLARRGPVQKTFEPVELRALAPYVDLDDLREQLRQTAEARGAADDEKSIAKQMLDLLFALSGKEFILSGKDGAVLDPEVVLAQRLKDYKFGTRLDKAKIHIHFLVSPVEPEGNESATAGQRPHLKAIHLEKNRLQGTGKKAKPLRTGEMERLQVPTLIRSIGNQVDPDLGLPMRGDGYAVREEQDEETTEARASHYHLIDLMSGETIPGVIPVGWARRPSYGKVGLARRDGINGVKLALKDFLLDLWDSVNRLLLRAGSEEAYRMAHEVLAGGTLPYLARNDGMTLSVTQARERVEGIRQKLETRKQLAGEHVVSFEDVREIERLETERGQKFRTHQEMFAALTAVDRRNPPATVPVPAPGAAASHLPSTDHRPFLQAIREEFPEESEMVERIEAGLLLRGIAPGRIRNRVGTDTYGLETEILRDGTPYIAYTADGYFEVDGVALVRFFRTLANEIHNPVGMDPEREHILRNKIWVEGVIGAFTHEKEEIRLLRVQMTQWIDDQRYEHVGSFEVAAEKVADFMRGRMPSLEVEAARLAFSNADAIRERHARANTVWSLEQFREEMKIYFRHQNTLAEHVMRTLRLGTDDVPIRNLIKSPFWQKALHDSYALERLRIEAFTAQRIVRKAYERIRERAENISRSKEWDLATWRNVLAEEIELTAWRMEESSESDLGVLEWDKVKDNRRPSADRPEPAPVFIPKNTQSRKITSLRQAVEVANSRGVVYIVVPNKAVKGQLQEHLRIHGALKSKFYRDEGGATGGTQEPEHYSSAILGIGRSLLARPKDRQFARQLIGQFEKAFPDLRGVLTNAKSGYHKLLSFTPLDDYYWPAALFEKLAPVLRTLLPPTYLVEHWDYMWASLGDIAYQHLRAPLANVRANADTIVREFTIANEDAYIRNQPLGVGMAGHSAFNEGTLQFWYRFFEGHGWVLQSLLARLTHLMAHGRFFEGVLMLIAAQFPGMKENGDHPRQFGSSWAHSIALHDGTRVNNFYNFLNPEEMDLWDEAKILRVYFGRRHLMTFKEARFLMKLEMKWRRGFPEDLLSRGTEGSDRSDFQALDGQLRTQWEDWRNHFDRHWDRMEKFMEERMPRTGITRGSRQIDAQSHALVALGEDLYKLRAVEEGFFGPINDEYVISHTRYDFTTFIVVESALPPSLSREELERVSFYYDPGRQESDLFVQHDLDRHYAEIRQKRDENLADTFPPARWPGKLRIAG